MATGPQDGEVRECIEPLHVPAGVLTLEQKAEMINGITSVLIAATKLPPDVNQQLWVQIFETAQGGWSLGGQVYVPRGQ